MICVCCVRRFGSISQPDLLRQAGTRLASSSRPYLSRKGPCLPRAPQPASPHPLLRKLTLPSAAAQISQVAARQDRFGLARTSPSAADMVYGALLRRRGMQASCFTGCISLLRVSRKRVSKFYFQYTSESDDSLTSVLPFHTLHTTRTLCNGHGGRQGRR